jgi:succinate dehydrogenase hydrophobic anchor subunit
MISMGCSVLLIISLLSDELDEIDVDRDMEGVRGGLVQSSTGLSMILCTLLLLSSSEVAGCSRATSVDIRLLKRELSSMVLMRVGGVVLVVVLIVVVVVKLLVAFGETSTFF